MIKGAILFLIGLWGGSLLAHVVPEWLMFAAVSTTFLATSAGILICMIRIAEGNL
jgi:hypothetical protein